MPRRSRLAVGLLLVLLAGFQGSAEPRAPEGFVGSFVWNMRNVSFGGFSAIEVGEDGGGFVALSDRGVFVAGQFGRDGSGKITAVQAGAIRPLLGNDTGKPLPRRRADAEGLAIAPSGEVFVSFENRTRAARLDLESGEVSDLDTPPAFGHLPLNKALEALAVGSGPTLYAVPEDPPTEDLPVYRWADGIWDDQMSLPRRGRFLPVAADIGPDGRFYLLERDFRAMSGFANRLRRFDLTEAGFSGETTLLDLPFALHDNLEGLSVWRDGQGQLRATMISDDNYIFVQQTQIVEYRLPD